MKGLAEMQYKDYDSMMASEPWLKYQTYDEDFNMMWKDNVPQDIKDKYEKWLTTKNEQI